MIFQKLYNYRELLKTSVEKEIRGKYKNSILGVAWSFFNPLLQLLVYSVIFGALFGGGDPTYHVYIVVALIPWTFFTTTLTQAAFTIIANGNILKKVYFPREILPISVVTSGLINFLIAALIIIGIIAFSAVGFSWHLIFFPIILFMQYILLLGLSFILSGVTVYFRDLEHVIGVVLMVGFYATPVVYKMEQLPVHLQNVIYFNPMTHVINGYRDIFYYHQSPDWNSLGILLYISIILLIVGCFIFQKLQKGFAEQL